jgi:hypothetical protein
MTQERELLVTESLLLLLAVTIGFMTGHCFVNYFHHENGGDMFL